MTENARWKAVAVIERAWHKDKVRCGGTREKQMNQGKQASKRNCHHQSLLGSRDDVHLLLSHDGHTGSLSVQLVMESPVTPTAGHFTSSSSPGKTGLHLSIGSSSSQGLSHVLPIKRKERTFCNRL